jgi:hypothetical protein
MKRSVLHLTLLVAAFTAACSGGGSTPPLPPPVGGFSRASLKGQYAFTMAGTAPDGFIARIGSFTSDGNGNITGGLELVSTGTNGLQELAFQQSGYQVNADGRGAINLTNVTGTISFSLTMISVSKGYIAQTDGITTTSGTFELQDTSAFTVNSLSGPYVFDNTGLDGAGSADSIVGQMVLNAGTVTSGVFDENAGTVASGPTAFSSGVYSIDAVNGSTAGVGAISFHNFQYAFVIVNSRKFHMIELPGTTPPFLPATIGTATAQVAPPTTPAAFTQNFAFLEAGVGVNSPAVRAGRFTADGNGNLSAVALDDKDVVNPVAQVPDGTPSQMKYTIDANFPTSGRGTVTFTDSKLGTYQFIFYMSSSSQGVIQDNSIGMVADGTILAQVGGPFTNAALAGDYAFNWSGVSRNTTNNIVAAEDFVGHVTLTSAAANNAAGAMDFSELNANQGAFHDVAISGGLTISGDGTTMSGGRNSFTIKAAGSNGGPATTINFTAYVVNPQTILVVSQDKDRSTGGAIARQTTPQ